MTQILREDILIIRVSMDKKKRNLDDGKDYSKDSKNSSSQDRKFDFNSSRRNRDYGYSDKNQWKRKDRKR